MTDIRRILDIQISSWIPVWISNFGYPNIFLDILSDFGYSNSYMWNHAKYPSFNIINTSLYHFHLGLEVMFLYNVYWSWKPICNFRSTMEYFINLIAF
jgi:hypothetical protein